MTQPRFVKHALNFKIISECSASKARVSQLELPHHTVETPVFMPVGTQGTLKGLIPEQLSDLDCQIMLGNTYHLGTRPGPQLLRKFGGLHGFMGWRRALLTDSGGFQMVSLLELAEITEQGVKFSSPYDGSECMLTPEHSMEIQNAIGADIIMQLDDVVHSSTTGPRVEEAMHRTTRWLDRCVRAHARPHEQNLFPIVQGGLDPELRRESVRQLTQREVAGFAIGGLSGGEEKHEFWRMVSLSTDGLPRDKPRYLMGVGFATDLVVCSALGCDMFDCVYPTRTARFGCALYKGGQLNLKQRAFARDFGPVDETCPCSTCARFSRAYLHSVVTVETAACHLLTVHNITYQVDQTVETAACHLLTVHNITYQFRLMKSLRESIKDGRFPEFVQTFMEETYPDGKYPEWVIDALASVNIHL